MGIEIINEELKKKLGDELFNQVNDVFKDANVVIETQDNFIPKHRFNEVSEKAKKLESYADYEDIKKQNEELLAKTEQFKDYDELKEKAAKLEEYADYDDIKTKYGELEKKNKSLKLVSLGVDPDFTEYVMDKLADSENFEADAEKFIQENAKFKAETFRNIDSNLPLNGGAQPDIKNMSDEDYIKYRKDHNVDGTKKK